MKKFKLLHDPLNTFEVVSNEYLLRAETGYDVADLESRLVVLKPGDANEAGLEAFYAELIARPRLETWNYVEPDALEEIEATWTTTDSAEVTWTEDQILGAWLGRIAGCNLGKPIERGTFWKPAKIREYLELFDAYPLRDYVPVRDELVGEYELLPMWPETSLGRINGGCRDDDVDYSILGLHLLEQHPDGWGPDVTAEAWQAFLPYWKTFTAERAVYANLLRGVDPAQAADVRNPYREWVGALIRADIFGWARPGQEHEAARLAYGDAILAHRANGIYGEMWAAALVAAAFTATSVEEIVERANDVLPPQSRTAEAVRFVQELRALGKTYDEALAAIWERNGHYSWVHVVNNAAVIALGLLWSDGDFTTAIGNTVMGGLDTDSNGATVGSIMGVFLGAKALPEHFVGPLHDRTRSAVFGYDNSRISDLAKRTMALVRTP